MPSTIRYLLIVFFLFLSFFLPSLYAAGVINLRYQPTVLPSPVSPLSLASLPHLASSLQDSPDLKQVSKSVDVNGNTHIRFQQTYRGYPVIGAEQFIHITADGKMTQNGMLIKNIQNDLKNSSPLIFTKQQSDKAVEYVLSHYLQESHLLTKKKSVPQLMVYLDTDHKAHWVFKVSFYFTAPVRDNPIYLLDAKTFQVYEKSNGIQFFDKVKGGGLGGNPIRDIVTYDGLLNHEPALNILRDSEKGICYLQNDTVIVKDGRKELEDDEVVYGDNNGGLPVLSFPCEQPDATHGNIYWDGALDETNSAPSPGNDALYLGGKVNQMFIDWFNTPVLANPSSNSSTPIELVVHDRHGKVTTNSEYTLNWWPTNNSDALEKGHIYIKLNNEDDGCLLYKLLDNQGNIITNLINSSEMGTEEWNLILPALKNQTQENLNFLNDKEKDSLLALMVSRHGLSKTYDGGNVFNAEWDGQSQKAYFGDAGVYTSNGFISFSSKARGIGLYTFVGPDIVAHELGHGFSQKHANFSREKREAQAIDESFADMTSKAFEYYLTGKTTWTIGADIGKAIRYMDEPTKDCSEKPCSIDNIKDFSSSTDPHNASGIFNKVFYLLATSPGWNTRKAYEVMVQANRHQWVSNLDFNEAACGVWDAGNDLHLASSEMSGIATSMAAVGLIVNDSACHHPIPVTGTA